MLRIARLVKNVKADRSAGDLARHRTRRSERAACRTRRRAVHACFLTASGPAFMVLRPLTDEGETDAQSIPENRA